MALPQNATGNIYCICGGTRGDQQPLVMTAVALKKVGYDIIMCIGSEGGPWCLEYGFEHYELDSFETIVRENTDVKAAAEDNGDFTRLMQAMGAQIANSFTRELPVLCARMQNDPSCVGLIASSTHATVAEVVARKMGIASLALVFSPFSPTRSFPPYTINTRDRNSWQQHPEFAHLQMWSNDYNLVAWESMIDLTMTTMATSLDTCISMMEAEQLFPSSLEGKKALLRSLWTASPSTNGDAFCHAVCQTMFAYSEVLVGSGGPDDWEQSQKDRQCGYVFDVSGDGKESVLSSFSKELENFLEKGEEPIYFGWGSMCRENNGDLVRGAIATCKRLGKRGLILRGWAHLSLDMLEPEQDSDLFLYAAEHILFVDKVNHLRLFPKCACIVAHAGAGTAACMLRSGKPCVITPVWWDQNFMGDRCENLGCGLRGPHFSKLSGDNLAPLIMRVLEEPSFLVNAAAVRESILARPGGDAVIAKKMHDLIQSKLPADRSDLPKSVIVDGAQRLESDSNLRYTFCGGA